MRWLHGEREDGGAHSPMMLEGQLRASPGVGKSDNVEDTRRRGRKIEGSQDSPQRFKRCCHPSPLDLPPSKAKRRSSHEQRQDALRRSLPHPHGTLSTTLQEHGPGVLPTDDSLHSPAHGARGFHHASSGAWRARRRMTVDWLPRVRAVGDERRRVCQGERACS
jgi:hypothetical protein